MIAKHCWKRGGGIIKAEEKRPGVVAGVCQVEPQLLLLPPPLFATYHLVIIPLCTSEASTCGCAAQYALCAALQSLSYQGASWRIGLLHLGLEVPPLRRAPAARAAVVTEAVNSSSARTALPDNAAPLLSANRAVREGRESSFEY